MPAVNVQVTGPLKVRMVLPANRELCPSLQLTFGSLLRSVKVTLYEAAELLLAVVPADADGLADEVVDGGVPDGAVVLGGVVAEEVGCDKCGGGCGR